MSNRATKWAYVGIFLLFSMAVVPVQGQTEPMGQTQGRKTQTAQALPAPSVALKPLVSTTPRSDPYTPHVPARAIVYQRISYALGLSHAVWYALGLWLFLATGFAARLRDWVYRVCRKSEPKAGKPPPFRAVAGFVSVCLLLVSGWSLPFTLASFALEHRYGFSTESVFSLLQDITLETLFSLYWIPLLWAGFWLVACAPRHWWAWLWAAVTPLLLVQFFLQPLVIEPQFNRFTPLAPGSLRTHLEQLAARAGIHGERIYVRDTSRRSRHVNAYVNGIGSSARIVIEDTALTTLPEDQLLAMLGHEMGHYVEGHLWYMSGAAILGAGLFLWLARHLFPFLLRRYGPRWRLHGLNDIAAVPLVLLVLYLFLQAQMPLANAESRYFEHRADVFGLRVTGLNDATARMLVGFAERDYSDPDPPALLHFWYGSHPTLKERIAFALSYRP